MGFYIKKVHNRHHRDRFVELIISLPRLHPKCFRSLSHVKFTGKFKLYLVLSISLKQIKQFFNLIYILVTVV